MLSKPPKVGNVPGKADGPALAVRQQSKSPNEPGSGDVVDGRYRLLEPLGQGGMGVVWKARSTALDVDVAVKLVRGAVASPESFKRMAREAHAAARLGHPAVARVLDFGSTQDAKPFVVMELLQGESLADRLDRQSKFEIVEAISLLLPLIEGLAEAHHQGIVHRDIKPENLFLAQTSRGRIQPKVLDFGIAKLDQQSDSSTKLTQDGAVLGSPGYFSPEQACGRLDIDHRTDIWSISVVLYELITGELPFNGPNYNALLRSILQDEPRSLLARGHGDEALWDIVSKGLARRREDRWQSMACLGQALAEWLVNRGVRSDITARSLRDVWLKRGDSVASPAAPFSPAKAERSKLSTLVNRHDADTLAGGTLSLARGVPKRAVIPAKALAALSVGALAAVSWFATPDSQRTKPVAATASPVAPHSSNASALPPGGKPPPAATTGPTVSTVTSAPRQAPPATNSQPVGTRVPKVEPRTAAASPPQRPAPQEISTPRAPKTQVAPKSGPKPPQATERRPTKPELRPETARVAPPRQRPAQQPPSPTLRQKVDAEFGF